VEYVSLVAQSGACRGSAQSLLRSIGIAQTTAASCDAVSMSIIHIYVIRGFLNCRIDW